MMNTRILCSKFPLNSPFYASQSDHKCLSLSSFRYRFFAQVPGTHFYHSHSSFQRGDGAFGAYTVREPREQDPLGDLYDEDKTEHVVFLQEYFHKVRVDTHIKSWSVM